MPEFVYDIPLNTLAIYFALMAFAATAAGIIFVKPILRVLTWGTGPEFNESIGHGTSAFNLFYGLLLGLLTVAAYQNNEDVKQAILNEATTISALYADMSSYPEPVRSDMKGMLRDYVLFTIHKDWDAHRKGTYLNGGFNRANAMRQRLAGFEPTTKGQEIVHAQVTGAFEGFMSARQQRLTGAIVRIPDVLWYAVLMGAALNILLLVMLRMPLMRQFVLGVIAAFYLGVILFVIVALDNPLHGSTALPPEPLQILWDRTMSWDEARENGS